MQKVRLKFNEYMASLPPYRFAAGDVIEIDEDWATQLVQRGIARKAGANAQTVQEIRAEERDAQADVSSQDREARRAALQAELAAIAREEAEQPYGGHDEGGHFTDMIGREDVDGTAAPAENDAAKASASRAKR